MSYANNKGADQSAHLRSLISAFVVRCLDSVMSLVSVTKISSLKLASVAGQASLSLTWSETPEDTFSHDEAQMLTSCKKFRICTVSINDPRHEKMCRREFPTRSDSNWPAQLQKLARGLKFWLQKLETLH